MSIDVAAARADTPGCSEIVHFNNAGSALSPRPVTQAVIAQIEAEASIGGYEAADLAAAQLDAFYDSAARLVGGACDEIAWVENGTRAWDMAFYGLDWRPGDKVVTNRSEYGSNYVAYLHAAQRWGIEIVVAPDDACGQIDVAALETQIDERVRLISICHIPTNGGLVNPAAAVGAAARRHGIPFLLDAVQSAGQLPLDVREIGCTMLAVTGRKYLRGPRGTGFLWVASDWIGRLDPPLLDNHAAQWTAPDRYEVAATARRFENFEMYNAGRIGLGRAIDYALDLGLPAIRDRVYALAGTLRAALSDVPGVTLRDLGEEKCGIVTFTTEGHDPAAVSARLRGEFATNTSVTRQVFTRLDMEDRGLDSMVRASVHYYNTEDEIDRFVEAMKTIVA